MTRSMLLLALLMLCECKAQVGVACFKDSECSADIDGGYCAKVEICTRQCGLQGDDCPRGSHCSPMGARSICLHSCRTDRDCNVDYGFICRGDPAVCVYAEPLAVPPWR